MKIEIHSSSAKELNNLREQIMPLSDAISEVSKSLPNGLVKLTACITEKNFDNINKLTKATITCIAKKI